MGRKCELILMNEISGHVEDSLKGLPGLMIVLDVFRGFRFKVILFLHLNIYFPHPEPTLITHKVIQPKRFKSRHKVFFSFVIKYFVTLKVG